MRMKIKKESRSIESLIVYTLHIDQYAATSLSIVSSLNIIL